MSPEFLARIPKVELHVHLEGSIRPETVLQLAARNGISLPADTVEGLQAWYAFRDFPHFVEVYVEVSKCIRTADDLELLVREFLEEQARQNVLYSEFTYTVSTIEKYAGLSWKDQFAALQRGLAYGAELGTEAQIIIDIVRGDSLERAQEVLGWVKEGLGHGVCALGIAGEERLGTELYAPVFEAAQALGIPVVAHAGETVGPESIWEALRLAHAKRIGHGVRCVEDPELVKYLVQNQTPLEVCPSSNVCLGVYPSLAEHPLPRMLDEGMNVTINSDDPPMFGTSLTEEWIRVCREFELTEDMVFSLMQNAVNASLLPTERKAELRTALREGFAEAAE